MPRHAPLFRCFRHAAIDAICHAIFRHYFRHFDYFSLPVAAISSSRHFTPTIAIDDAITPILSLLRFHAISPLMTLILRLFAYFIFDISRHFDAISLIIFDISPFPLILYYYFHAMLFIIIIIDIIIIIIDIIIDHIAHHY
jgi:hypothetical protein